jgi:hypothetical protein
MLPTPNDDFTFNHYGQPNEYGRSVENYTVVQQSFDSRAEENRDMINAIIEALEAVTDSDSGADAIGMTALANNGSATETVQAQVEDLDTAIGDRSYTEDNYVTDSESLTASIDALDQELKDVSDATDGKVTGAGAVTADNLVQFSDTSGSAIKGGLAVTTSVGSPGANTNIPTEAAVRAAISDAGGGDVTGPESATNDAIAAFDGETGNLIKEAVPRTDYALPPVTISATLTSAGWVDQEQDIEDAAIYSATAPGDVKISQDATETEFDAWSAALIRVVGQAIGSITLRVADAGAVPTVNIPVIVEVR